MRHNRDSRIKYRGYNIAFEYLILIATMKLNAIQIISTTTFLKERRKTYMENVTKEPSIEIFNSSFYSAN